MAYYYNKKQARLNAISKSYANKEREIRLTKIAEKGLMEELRDYEKEHPNLTSNQAVANFCRKNGIN